MNSFKLLVTSELDELAFKVHKDFIKRELDEILGKDIKKFQNECNWDELIERYTLKLYRIKELMGEDEDLSDNDKLIYDWLNTLKACTRNTINYYTDLKVKDLGK